MKEVLFAMKRLSRLAPAPVTVAVEYDARDDCFWFRASAARDGRIYRAGKTVAASAIETMHDADGFVVIMVGDFIWSIAKRIECDGGQE